MKTEDIQTGDSGRDIAFTSPVDLSIMKKVRSYKEEYEKMKKEANAWKKGFIGMCWVALALTVALSGIIEYILKLIL